MPRDNGAGRMGAVAVLIHRAKAAAGKIAGIIERIFQIWMRFVDAGIEHCDFHARTARGFPVIGMWYAAKLQSIVSASVVKTASMRNGGS